VPAVGLVLAQVAVKFPPVSVPEAFSVSMVGGGQEKTLDYGRTINPVATKAFFLSLLNGSG